MVTTRTLCGLAGVGGLVTALTGYTLHGILQKRVKDSLVYKEAMKKISHPSVGPKYLGVPIRSENVDVGNKSNILSPKYCQLELPVYGPKSKGIVYIKADRLAVEDNWNLFKLDLEILDDFGGKISIINKNPVLHKESFE